MTDLYDVNLSLLRLSDSSSLIKNVQIMLCAVYIVCKVLRPTNEIKFVDILAAYRTQPQFNREVIFLAEKLTFSVIRLLSGNILHLTFYRKKVFLLEILVFH